MELETHTHFQYLKGACNFNSLIFMSIAKGSFFCRQASSRLQEELVAFK
jgi:hypothetical protein